jgi:chromosome segregation ATPase
MSVRPAEVAEDAIWKATLYDSLTEDLQNDKARHVEIMTRLQNELQQCQNALRRTQDDLRKTQDELFMVKSQKMDAEAKYQALQMDYIDLQREARKQNAIKDAKKGNCTSQVSDNCHLYGLCMSDPC